MANLCTFISERGARKCVQRNLNPNDINIKRENAEVKIAASLDECNGVERRHVTLPRSLQQLIPVLLKVTQNPV